MSLCHSLSNPHNKHITNIVFADVVKLSGESFHNLRHLTDQLEILSTVKPCFETSGCGSKQSVLVSTPDTLEVVATTSES